jgi:N-acetyl-anhydromuramyl-L-alanine amidase AmpD
MPALFVGCAAENFRVGRPAGFAPEAIVLHRTGGSRADLRARFNNPAASTSAHYVVCRDGSVDQYVGESDTAFHAGVVVGATWPGLRTGVNPNFYTIGIELEGAVTDEWPAAQIEALATLLAEVSGRLQIAIDPLHVVAHSAIRSSSACPGASCPIADIIKRASTRTLTLATPARAVVRLLSRANVRRGRPSTSAAVDRVLEAGSDAAVTGFTDVGERVQGNAFWYALDDDGFIWAGATDVPAPAPAGASGGTIVISKTTDEMELAADTPPPAPPPAAGLEIDRTTLVLPAKQFIGETTAKEMVVLHFTAGTTARSAFDTWKNDEQRVATSYIVDIDGRIYELFPPRFWAAHLGVKGTQNRLDRKSIGIEIVNVGPLAPSADDPQVLNWWPPKTKGAPPFTTRFCTRSETDRYVAANFRDKGHFAAFPDVQVDAVGALVRELCRQFSIPLQLPSQAKRFVCDVPAFDRYEGVCTHANFRQDKWDIGPAFDWDRLGI